MNEVRQVDAIEGLLSLPSGSVDMLFSDLPYGVTQNPWDVKIPFGHLWEAVQHACKPAAALVFTAIQPFASELVLSAPKPVQFRYEIVWVKNKARGFLNANRQPLRKHELVEVFSVTPPLYQPQKTTGHRPSNAAPRRGRTTSNYGQQQQHAAYPAGVTERYPTTILEIPVVNNDRSVGRTNETQKPPPLIAWFIRTHTLPGALVCDPVCGSGSSLVAAAQCDRKFVGFDIRESQVKAARAAIARHERDVIDKGRQRSLFGDET